MTAPAVKELPHTGVVKPDLQFAGALVNNAIRYHWRQYHFYRRMYARWHLDFDRGYIERNHGALLALLAIRRACRPVRLGGK